MSEQTSTVETIEADSQDALVSVKDMEVYFPVTAGLLVQRKVADVKAVDGVSFSVKRGETLGLVGESGSGKTTLGRTILHLTQPTEGEVLYRGQNLS